MKGTLISDMENEVMEGIRKTNTDGQGGEKASPQTPLLKARGVVNPQISSLSPSGGGRGEALSHQPSEQEPTKGVQTYIPMSLYRRLNDIKLTRRENIAALVEQAIELWLDVQEGKRKVSE